MANTYSQIYIQIVFAVESRQNLIDPQHNEDLAKVHYWNCDEAAAETDRYQQHARSFPYSDRTTT